ncbi:hypothetical protein I317_05365 [Kwoniella heveanensis CBS 569]|nr:hypothetical protein I317_05365 [Kwoniella heveanensis CBS 569]
MSLRTKLDPPGFVSRQRQPSNAPSSTSDTPRKRSRLDDEGDCIGLSDGSSSWSQMHRYNQTLRQTGRDVERKPDIRRLGSVRALVKQDPDTKTTISTRSESSFRGQSVRVTDAAPRSRLRIPRVKEKPDESKTEYDRLVLDLQNAQEENQALTQLHTKSSLETHRAEAQIKELEGKLQVMETELEQSKSAQDEMSRELEDIEEVHRAALERQLLLAEERVKAELEDELKLADTKVQELEDALTACKGKAKRKNGKIDVLQQQLAEMKKELESAERDCKEHLGEIQDLQERVDQHSKQSEAHKLQNEWLIDEKQRLEKENEQLRASNAAYEDCYGEFDESDEVADGPSDKLTDDPLDGPQDDQQSVSSPAPSPSSLQPDISSTAECVSEVLSQPALIQTALGDLKPALYTPPSTKEYRPGANSTLAIVPPLWPQKRRGFSRKISKVLSGLRQTTLHRAFRHSQTRCLKPFKYDQLDDNQRLRWREIMSNFPPNGISPNHVKCISEKPEWGIQDRGSSVPIVEPEIIRWSCLHQLVVKEALRESPNAELLASLFEAEYTSYIAIHGSGLLQFPTKEEGVS